MTSFNKIVEMDEYFNSGKTMEPTVQLLSVGSHSRGITKLASEASEWASSVKSVPGKTYILVLAMGASEFYGPNRNGDAFRESELRKTYKSFESNAHVFRSHVNKDPAKSMGSVVKAFYNEDMHRVELILCLDDSKCPDIVDKIRNNETVAVSMGCRIEYDVCTICGNKAPSRKEYCKHLLDELNDIYSDGRIVAADNPNPNFFDISVVYKPADKTGYMLKKVANFGGKHREVGESSALLAEKAAAMTAVSQYLSKAADIEKIVTGVGFSTSSGGSSDSANSHSSDKDYLAKKWLQTIVPKIAINSSKVDDHDLQFLSTKELPKVLSSLSDMGLFLTTPEFLDLVFLKVTGKKSPEGLGSKLISLQGDIFRLIARHPDVITGVVDSGHVSEDSKKDKDSKDIESKMASYKPLRGLAREDIMLRAHNSKAVHITPVSYIPRLKLAECNADLVKLAVELSVAYKISSLDRALTGGTVLPNNLTKMAAAMPWAPLAVSALDRVAGGVSRCADTNYTSGIAKYASSNNVLDVILNLIYS